eukprot:GHVO01009407.1.p1 GENE.GHVO01009407.1~~GHVO01009407.1.p1  ORF type:complete len:139 (+),score=17.60 GHVO01009407.1:96-512(+)
MCTARFWSSCCGYVSLLAVPTLLYVGILGLIESPLLVEVETNQRKDAGIASLITMGLYIFVCGALWLYLKIRACLGKKPKESPPLPRPKGPPTPFELSKNATLADSHHPSNATVTHHNSEEDGDTLSAHELPIGFESD